MKSLAKKYGCNLEQKQLLSRIEDLADLAEKRDRPCCMGFLTPAEQLFLLKITELNDICRLEFDGGYPQAERKLAVVKPQYECEEIQLPISILAVECRERVGHRDILGSVMALGIKRDRVGDILDRCTPPIFICDSGIAPLITAELNRVGRLKVRVHSTIIEDIPDPQIVIRTATVASLRLDSIVAEGFKMSRVKAASLIKSGAACLNWVPCDNVSSSVTEGDKISLRGYGKIELKEIGSNSKKGRTFVTIAKYGDI